MPLLPELALWQFSLFHSPCACLSAYLCFKPNSRKVSLYSELTIFLGIFSPMNAEQTHHDSPVRAGYGVSLWVHNLIRVLSLFILLRSISRFIRKISLHPKPWLHMGLALSTPATPRVQENGRNRFCWLEQNKRRNKMRKLWLLNY